LGIGLFAKRSETGRERDVVKLGMMQYTVYAVLGICCTGCRLCSVYAVLGACCAQYMLYSVYAELGDDSLSWHRDECLNSMFFSNGRVENKKKIVERRWGK
jgi:hypothetical protein